MLASDGIVMRKVSDLVERPNNEKEHTDAQIDRICDSIKAHGFLDPLEVLESGEVVSGNGRLAAARKMGLEEVPTVTLSLSDAEARGYGIAANQTTLSSGLDMDKVASEFERLGIEEEDYGPIGFTEDEVIFMLPEQRDILDDDEIESPYMDTDTWSDLVPKMIRTRVVFDDSVQQVAFEQFLEKLRDRYPEEVAVCDRLMRFADEFFPSQGAL